MTAPSEPSNSGSLTVDGVVDVVALDALAGAFNALDEEGQFDRLNVLSEQLERDLFELSGLADALGRTETVDASVSETGLWLAARSVEVQGSIESAEFEPHGFRNGAPAQTDGVPSLGAGLFGGMMVSLLGSEAAVTSTNDGRPVSGELAKGVKLEGTRAKAELATEGVSTDSHGVTTTLKTRNVVTPCPAADGTFTASASIDTSSSINNGATGQRATLEVTITGTVDDNAALVGYDISSRSQYADFVDSRGGFLDLTISIPQTGTTSATINRTGGTVTSDVVDNAVALNRLMLLLAGGILSKAAQQGWESGRCVDLTTSVSAGPKGLAPSATVTISAAPRSRIEAGAPVGGTVTALLTGGEAAVTPSSTPVPADAEFTYDAPDEQDETGQVSLESRSKRGVAKAKIDFDTKQTGYLVDAMWGDFALSGSICGAGRPFQLDATSSYGSLIMDFTWTSETGGSIAFAGNVDEAVITGTGSFVVGLDGEGGTLSIDTKGTGVMEGFEVPSFVDSTTFPLQPGGDCE